jgi:glutathione S-transferase
MLYPPPLLPPHTFHSSQRVIAGQVPVLWLPTERAISESDVIMDYLITLPPPKKAE